MGVLLLGAIGNVYDSLKTRATLLPLPTYVHTTRRPNEATHLLSIRGFEFLVIIIKLKLEIKISPNK